MADELSEILFERLRHQGINGVAHQADGNGNPDFISRECGVHHEPQVIFRPSGRDRHTGIGFKDIILVKETNITV